MLSAIECVQADKVTPESVGPTDSAMLTRKGQGNLNNLETG